MPSYLPVTHHVETPLSPAQERFVEDADRFLLWLELHQGYQIQVPPQLAYTPLRHLLRQWCATHRLSPAEETADASS